MKRTLPLVVLYSGGKTPTVEVVRRVQRAMKAQPEMFNAVFDLMDKAGAAGFQALRAGALRKVGELFNIQQGLMEALGVSNARMGELVYALRAERGILGAKISGSGLGDCVIGVGRSDARGMAWTADRGGDQPGGGHGGLNGLAELAPPG